VIFEPGLKKCQHNYTNVNKYGYDFLYPDRVEVRTALGPIT